MSWPSWASWTRSSPRKRAHGSDAGYVGFAQADLEPVQGVHAMVTGETVDHGAPGETTSFGEWLSAAWFTVPHVDMRFDAIRRSRSGTPDDDDLPPPTPRLPLSEAFSCPSEPVYSLCGADGTRLGGPRPRHS